MTELPGAEPFYFEKGTIGCLLIHGFTGSPFEMRELGEKLSEKDITVHAPLLKGHGTSPEDLLPTTWKDWHKSVKSGYEKLNEQCSKVFVCGLSMGGLQALYLAQTQPDIAGVVSLSAPVYMKNPKVTLLLPLMKLSLVKNLYRYDKGIGRDIKDPEAREKMVCYDKVPTWAAQSLFEFMDIVREGLSKITQPILVMQGKEDHLVHPGNGPYIHEHVSSKKKKLIMLENSYHVVTLDYDREKVFKEALSFIKQN